MACWLSTLGVDWRLPQRQGHTPLHKAAWGGHQELCAWLFRAQGVWDDARDAGGNFAGDIAEMAGHSALARWLRRECSLSRRKALSILGFSASETVTTNSEFPKDLVAYCSSCASVSDAPGRLPDKLLRAAFLERCRRVHPDKKGGPGCSRLESACEDFGALVRAYRLLSDPTGAEALVQAHRNPNHNLPLLLLPAELPPPQTAAVIETASDRASAGNGHQARKRGCDQHRGKGSGHAETKGAGSWEKCTNAAVPEAMVVFKRRLVATVREYNETCLSVQDGKCGEKGSAEEFFVGGLSAGAASAKPRGLPLALLPKRFEQLWRERVPTSGNLGLRPGLGLKRLLLIHCADVVKVHNQNKAAPLIVLRLF